MRGVSPSMALMAASTLTMATLSAAATTTCSKGLHMVVARGSEEPQGLGVTANLTDQIQSAIPNSDATGIVYPATLDNYTSSEAKGVTAMHAALEDYAKACPGSKMAILGYSQGAQIGMDSICGGLGGIYTSDAAVSSSILDSIVAVAVFGDPTHIANLTYDRGTSIKNGLFPRNNTAPCLALADKIVSYCDKDDIYCDSGSVLAVHHEYIDKYGTEIVKFVVDKYNADVDGSGSGSSSGNNGTQPSSGSGSASPSASASSPASPSPSSPSNTTTSSKPTPVPGQNAAGSLNVPFQSLLIGAAGLVAFTAALL